MYEAESALFHTTKHFILSSMTNSAQPVASAQKRNLVHSDRLLANTLPQSNSRPIAPSLELSSKPPYLEFSGPDSRLRPSIAPPEHSRSKLQDYRKLVGGRKPTLVLFHPT